MNIDEIGKNAGIIWRTLHNSDQEMSLQALTENTGLDLLDVVAAIGWLARENKIYINESKENYLLNVFKEYYF